MTKKNKGGSGVAMAPVPKKLTELEVSKLEKASLLAEFRFKEREILDLQDKIISLKKENLSLRIQSLDGSKVQSNENRKALEKQAKTDAINTKEIHDNIKSRLEIDVDRFGYHPDTHEIVLDH